MTNKKYQTVAEAKKGDKKRTTVATNIQFDKVTENYIVELYMGTKDGKAIRKHETFKSLTDAKNRLTEHKEQMRKGQCSTTACKMTLGECIKQYLDTAQIEETTKRGYISLDNRISTHPIYNVPLQNVKKSHIMQYQSDMRNTTTLSNATINKDFQLIRRVLGYAVEMEYIFSNPANGVKKLKEKKRENQPLTPDEGKKLLQEAENSKDWSLIVSVYLGLYNGLRRGEILGLKWSAVSLENNTIKINSTRTRARGKIIEKAPKTEKSNRDLAISNKVKDILLQAKEYQEKNGFFGEYVVVTSEGTPIDPDYMSRKFACFLSYIGIRHVRFHDLRHTFGTRMIDAGASVTAVSGAMGHASTATTLNYYVHTKSFSGSTETNSFADQIFG